MINERILGTLEKAAVYLGKAANLIEELRADDLDGYERSVAAVGRAAADHANLLREIADRQGHVR